MRASALSLCLLCACGGKPTPQVQPSEISSEWQPDAGPPDAGLYFPPAGPQWERVSDSAGWDATALAAAADFAAQNNSSALLILDHGRVVLEQYWPDPRTGAPVDAMSSGEIYSAGKSVTSELLGEAISRDLVSLDKPVSDYLGEGWSSATPAQERAILVRHLVTMTSGLSETPALRYVAPAGTRWSYNSDAYYKVIAVLEQVTGKSRDTLLSEWLARPTGMDHATWSGNVIVWSARDMARFGLLMLANGEWNGEVVLHDRAYVEASLRPSQPLNPSYGFLWWLNGQGTVVLPGDPTPLTGPLIPAAPADLVAALGAGDKKIYVCPSEGWVVVRHGAPATSSRQALSSFDNLLWEKIMAAAPRP